MKNFIEAYAQSGYVWNEEESKLVWFNLESICLDFQSGTIVYHANDGKEIVDKYSETDFFETVDNFRNNESLQKKSFALRRAVEETCHWDCCSQIDIKQNESVITAYVWEQEPVKKEISNFKVSYNVTNRSYVLQDTEKIYSCREDLFYDHSFTTIDESGHADFHEAYGNRLALTPEQKEVLQKFLHVCAEANKVGLELIVDYSYDMLYAFNKNNLKSWDVSDCAPNDSIDVRKELIPNQCFPLVIAGMDCNDFAFVFKD